MPEAHVHTHSKRSHHGMPKMPDWLSVEQALEKILSYVKVLEPETKSIIDALGQTLAEDVRASFPVPPHANSSMDGYAVQWDDIKGASDHRGSTLKVIGELPAGQVPSKAVTPGNAI